MLFCSSVCLLDLYVINLLCALFGAVASPDGDWLI